MNLSNPEQDPAINEALPFAYIDGSFSEKQKTYSYGGFLFDGTKTHILQGTGNNEEYTDHRNVTGEVRGALEVIKTATELNLQEINLFFDYSGIEQWACNRWACKNKLTQFYKAYYDRHNVKIHFYQVKGHTGNPGNEIADLLAKEALQIKMTKKQAAALSEFKASAAL